MNETLPIKKPMKGEQVDDFSQLRFPLIASPKIDGFRCVLGQQPYTSRLSPFPNEYFKDELKGVLPDGCFLDAEAVVGDRRGEGVLQKTSSGLTSRDGQPDFTLWVFDRPGFVGGWHDRYMAAGDLIKSVGHPRIKLLKHTQVYNPQDLEQFLADKLEAGYEGIMVRDPNGRYKEGKGTLREQLLLKVKPFVDAEGKVIGFFEEEENKNEATRDATGKLKRSSAKAGKVGKGRLGGFILKDLQSGIEVSVGGGFTLLERIAFWQNRQELLGRIVKYKKQATGEKNKPRHPNYISFLDFRPNWDIS